MPARQVRERDARRVLVLTSDGHLGSAVREELDRNDLHATVLSRPAEARRHVEAGCYDAFVVDLGLPDGAGYGFVAELRAGGRGEPVLLLSAPHAPQDLLTVQRGWPGWQPTIRQGLHDIPSILQALLRHERPESARRLRYAGITLDRFERRACIEDAEVSLTPAEFRILEQLVLNAEHLVTREALLQNVWGPERQPDSNALDVHLGHLRKKLRSLEESAGIDTVRGRGYVLKRRPGRAGASAA